MFRSKLCKERAGPLYPSTSRSLDLEESPLDLLEAGHATSLPVSALGWYRVLVFSKDRCGIIKQDLRRIQRIIKPLYFLPRYQHTGGEDDAAEDAGACFTFYVHGYTVASALFRLGRVDSRLWLRVNNRMPRVRYSSEHRWALKEALLNRYDRRQRSLDLTLFHEDGILRGKFFALANAECMGLILKILEREMPELKCLRLDRNHLRHLMPFWNVERRLPQLQSISLEKNELNSLHSLHNLKNLKLVEMNLKHNLLPFGYEFDVLKMWPSLLKLNGHGYVPSRRNRHELDLEQKATRSERF